MKGTKGMQRKLILILMFLFGISNNALSLDIGKSEAFFLKTSDVKPNVATIADMIFEKPNEAFLPDENETIDYEVASVSDVENSDDYFEDKVEPSIDSVPEVKPTVVIAQVQPEKTLPVKPVKKEKVASLRSIDFVSVTPEKKTRSIAKAKKANDKFASIKVSEGEEVLVSSSEQQKVVNNEKVISKADVASEVIEETPSSENKVFDKSDKKEIKGKKNLKKKSKKTDSDIASKNVEKFVAVNDTKTEIPSTSASDENDSSDDNPFGVIVSKTKKSKSKKETSDIANTSSNPFIKAFSAIKPETNKKLSSSKKSSDVKVAKNKKKQPSIASSEMLKKDLHRAYLSGNQYLSAYEDESEEENEEALEEDVDEEISEEEEENEEEYQDDEGFTKQKNVGDALEGKGDKKVPVEKVSVKDVKKKLQDTKKSISAPSGPLKAGTREVLQMKIDFQDGSSAVSGESVNLIRSFAQIATEQPTNSIEITIPESVMNNPKKKKLTARRLSIVSNILRNAGISDRQILPVLSNRDEDSFAFRVVSNDNYTKLRISKGADIFGEEENVKEYDIMRW